MNAELHFLTKPAFASIMEHNPRLSKQWIFQKDDNKLIESLKAENFDLVFDLQKNLSSKKLISSLGLPHKTFDKKNIEKWLFVNFKYPPLTIPHLVDRYYDAFDLKNDGQGLEFFVDPKAEEQEAKSDEKYICIALGAAHQTKQIPDSIVMQICDRIKSKTYLLGGPGDKQKGDTIAAEKSHVINCAGTFSIHQSAAKLNNAAVLVTGDTGLMHMAVGLSIPTIVLWGNTVPELGMSPYYGDKDIASFNHEVPGLSCRPCSKLGKKTCPKSHFNCMNKQNIELIVEQILSFIDV